MKKRYIYMVVACIAVLGLGAMAHAQTPPSATGTPAATAAAKKARLQEAVANMERSFEARIAGLEGLAGRIQTRIGKLQLEGRDMTAATAKLAEAQKRITEAKTELATLKRADVAMIASAKPATAFGNVKNRYAKNITTKIKAAHKALVETIVLMKGQKGSATTTAPVVR